MDVRFKVVDASALGAMIFAEPKGEEIAVRLQGGPLAAPSLLWLEMANLCLKKIRKYPDQSDTLLKAFHLALRLPIGIYDPDPTKVLELAREHGLTAYDAAYLWLAENLGAELVTLDVKLMKERRKC